MNTAFFKAVSGSLLVRPIGMFLGLLVGIQLARGLGVEGYGVYGTALSILTVLGAIVDFGLPTLLTRESSKFLAKRDWPEFIGIQRWANSIVIAISVLVIALTYLAINFLGYDGDQVAVVVLAGLLLIPLVALQKNVTAVIRSLKYIVAGQLPDLVVRPLVMAVLLGVTLVIASEKLDPKLAILFQLVAVAMALGVACLILSRISPDTGGEISPVYRSVDWLRSAYPMALTEWIRVFQGHLAVIVLALIVSASEVGVFRVAVSLAMFVALPVSIVNVVCMPMFASAYSKGSSTEMDSILKMSVSSMFFGTGIIVFALLLVGDVIIIFLFGEEYAGANLSAKIICMGYLVGSYFGPGAVFLTMTGNESYVTKSYAISLITLLFGVVPLSWIFGSEGASLAVACSFVVLCLLQWRDSINLMGVDISLLGRYKKEI